MSEAKTQEGNAGGGCLWHRYSRVFGWIAGAWFVVLICAALLTKGHVVGALSWALFVTVLPLVKHIWEQA